MPIDPLHGRRIPSGARLARVIRDVLLRMLRHAQAAVWAGHAPDFARFEEPLFKAMLPILLHEWQLGREQAARNIRKRKVVSRKSSRLTTSFNLIREAVPRAIQQAILAVVGSITESLKQEVRDRMESGLRAGASNTSIADSLTTVFTPQRAATIAATEASRAMHAGETEYANEAGATGLEWLASSDACDRCLELSDKRVKFGEPFVVLTAVAPEYRNVMYPPLHPNCMCSTKTWWK